MTATGGRRLVAECLGTAALLVAVVGSGITMSDGGAASTQLFQHAVTVAVALVALILAFGPVSGAHFNPAVTAADWWFGGLPGRRALAYVAVQVVGAIVGTVSTHLMFGLQAVTPGTTGRDGMGVVVGEAVATAGLVIVIFALVRTQRTAAVAGAVGAWIGGAIVFTSSASFANPAVTVARALTDTWTSIDPTSVPGFLLGQAAGVVFAVALVVWLYEPAPAEARRVVAAGDPVDDHGDGRAPTSTPPATASGRSPRREGHP